MGEPESGIVARRRMFRMFPALWGGLPDFCALLPVVWCLSYGITLGVVGAAVGRQSSTFGIGIFFAFITAPFLGFMGLLLGRAARYVLGSRVPQRFVRVAKWCAPVLLLLVGVLASHQASGPIYAYEREARPRLILSSAQFNKRTGRTPAEGVRHAVRVYDLLAKINHPLQWGDRSVELVDAGETLEVRLSPAGTGVFIPLPGIDYIKFVDAMPLRMGPGASPVLALLITGRASGERDLVAIVSDSGKLVYLELLERSWNYDPVPLASTSSATGDVVLVGSGQQDILVFALQSAL
jgi:hypothetical protein